MEKEVNSNFIYNKEIDNYKGRVSISRHNCIDP